MTKTAMVKCQSLYYELVDEKHIAKQEFIASLAGRYQGLQDGYTVSGTGSHRFSNYLYSRKLLIRKSIQDEPERPSIYCTHCTRKVAAKFTTTSAQLRHFRHHHPRLPTTQEEEDAKIQELVIPQR